MKLSFIRHGRSREHDAGKKQSPQSRLSPTGIRQAELVAGRLQQLISGRFREYHSLISSPWPRALQTAKTISSVTGLDLSVHPGIHEAVSSRRLHHQLSDSEIVLHYQHESRLNSANLDWKYAGEGESVREVIHRAQAFKSELLSGHLGKNLVIVSHGLFITTFVALVILGDDYADDDIRSVIDLIRLENTSLTELEYLEPYRRWKLIRLNDHSHLEQLQTTS